MDRVFCLGCSDSGPFVFRSPSVAIGPVLPHRPLVVPSSDEKEGRCIWQEYNAGMSVSRDGGAGQPGPPAWGENHTGVVSKGECPLAMYIALNLISLVPHCLAPYHKGAKVRDVDYRGVVPLLREVRHTVVFLPLVPGSVQDHTGGQWHRRWQWVPGGGRKSASKITMTATCCQNI